MKKLIALLALTGLAFAGTAAAKTCELNITGNDQLQYNKSELVVEADCDKVKLTLEHVGEMPVEQMGHNWVLAETGDWKELAQAGQSAGLENDYLPAGDERVIVHTDMIGGGETTSITFDVSNLEKGGDYTYFCSFPGHWSIMNGKLIVK
jgi:azurin